MCGCERKLAHGRMLARMCGMLQSEEWTEPCRVLRNLENMNTRPRQGVVA